MSTPLTVHNAHITTAAVEVKTLTISGKQVTLAVFRQLAEEPLIAHDGSLNGEPWGIVNYHPDKCADSRVRHRHVVWQKGDQLRRAKVSVEASFAHDDYFDGNPEYWDDTTARFYAASIHRWLATGEVAYWANAGLFQLFTGELEAKIYGYSTAPDRIDDPRKQRLYAEKMADSFTFTHPAAKIRVGVEVAPEVKAAVLAEIGAREARERIELGLADDAHSNPRWCDCRECLDAKVTEADAKRADLATTFDGAPLDALWSEYQEAVTAEAERRAAYREAESARRARVRQAHESLASLPQLFIAV